MNSVLAWFARNGIVSSFMMILLVVGGILSFSALRFHTFPDVSYDLISVSVSYPGASPEEVETAVCARIEEQLGDIGAVRRIRSIALEGMAKVTIELLFGADMSQALDDVKARVDAIDSFPEDVEKPVVQKVDPLVGGMSIAIAGPADESTLVHLGEQIRDELEALPGITRVMISGARPFEVSIEISEEALRRFGLSFSEIARAIGQSSIDLPAGSVRAQEGEILLLARGQAYHGREFEELVLFTRSDGTRLTIGDVARVRDSFAEVDRMMRLDGEPAVLVQVYRVGGQDSLDIAEQVEEYLYEARSRMPEGIRLVLWQSEAEDLESRLATMLENGRDGFVLVLIVLALFLKPRLAFWVALGIPISFLGTLWCLPMVDISINLVSTLGFVVVLGIVVDDALVVGESIYRQREEGRVGVDASISGVCEVARPVIFSVVTTVVAFTPMLSVPGSIGGIMKAIPIIVILTLTFSLIEAFLILPSHLSHLGRRRGSSAEVDVVPDKRHVWERFQVLLVGGLDWITHQFYLPALRRAIAWRYLTLATAVAILVLSIGLVAGGRLGFAFFPPVEGDSLAVGVTFPQGSSVDSTVDALLHIEKAVEQLRSQLDDDPIRHVLTTVGSQPSTRGVQFAPGSPEANGAHLGEVAIRLVSSGQRNMTAEELSRRLRQLVGAIPDAVELSYNFALIEAGKAIDIELAEPGFNALRRSADSLKRSLGAYPGVYGIADSLQPGKREMRLSITQEAEALGLTLADLASQVRQGFYGEEVQRIQRGRHELKVMVRYPAEERRSLASLEEMRIRTAKGEVPFSVVGRAVPGRSFAAIDRTDGKRTLRVTADVDLSLSSPNDILGDLQRNVLPELLQVHPGLTYALGGEQQEQREAMSGLLRNTLLAFFLIYALLAIALSSYVQPLIIMSAVPFGVVGAIWGHLIMGNPLLTFYSVLGIVALSGVVLNDSLVLVDFINRSRRAGTADQEAVLGAGATRFRPILLTSLTTFAGLVPLLFESSLQAQFLIPMATSLAFGVLFATLISLFLVPVGYRILDDTMRLIGQ